MPAKESRPYPFGVESRTLLSMTSSPSSSHVASGRGDELDAYTLMTLPIRLEEGINCGICNNLIVRPGNTNLMQVMEKVDDHNNRRHKSDGEVSALNVRRLKDRFNGEDTYPRIQRRD